MGRRRNKITSTVIATMSADCVRALCQAPSAKQPKRLLIVYIVLLGTGASDSDAWRGGVTVWRRISDQEVAGSICGRGATA